MRKFSILILAMLLFASARAQPRKPRTAKDSVPTKVTYTYVEAMPKFNGDINADILSKLPLPDPCMEMSPGRCVAAFTVEPTGLLTELSIVRSSGCPQLDSEVVRLLIPMTKTPRWIPGRQHGKPAAVRYALPVLLHFDN